MRENCTCFYLKRNFRYSSSKFFPGMTRLIVDIKTSGRSYHLDARSLWHMTERQKIFFSSVFFFFFVFNHHLGTPTLFPVLARLMWTELQIRGGTEDNSKIIFLIFQ